VSAVRDESAEMRDGPVVSDRLAEVLLDDSPPFDVDWSMPARLLDEDGRLERLARVKALLPADNVIEEKSTHDVTLENYIRLALQAAGDRETLGHFLEAVHRTLEERRPGTELLAQQVFWIWAPAAEIADMHRMKVGLEELAFEILMPEEHARIRDMYEAAGVESQQAFLAETERLIFEAVQPVIPGIRPEDVTGRRKSYYGAWRKHRDRNEDYAISDFIGFRVVVDGETEEEAVGNCYAAVGEICRYFDMDPERFKDYIAQPKLNGYRSLHLTLYNEQGRPIELQVRTRAMHEVAESDAEASHLLYDAAYKEVPGKVFRHYRRVPKLYAWREQAARALQENLGSTEVVDGEMLFFRQDGNLYLIEAGATVLDGAFRIHSERALRVRAIEVNARLVDFATPLNFGDLVDVEHRPGYPEDLFQLERLRDNVTTELAHKAIDRARRRLLRAELIAKGRQIVCDSLRKLKVDDPFSVLDEVDRRYLADRAGVPAFEDLLAMAGAGDRTGKPGRIAHLIRVRLGAEGPVRIKLAPERLQTASDAEVVSAIHVPNYGGELDCRVAGCCSQKIAIGDDVVARAIRAEALMSLHRAGCINVRYYPGLISCSWDSATLEA
jgi:guanosine-3',5'-bis(diphosphate) 3'-pyrophosphohydrolase